MLAILGATVLMLPEPWEAGRWPMSLGQGLVGSLFFAMGHWARQDIPPRHAALGALAIAASIMLALANGRVDLFAMQFRQPLMYTAAVLLGVWGIVAACHWPPIQSKALQLFGRHSLLILAVHMPRLWLLRGAMRSVGIPELWWVLTLFCALTIVVLALWRDWIETAKARPES